MTVRVRRRAILRLIALGTVLSACGPASPLPATPAPATSAPTSAAAPTPAQPAPGPTATSARVESATPTPQPAAQSRRGGTLRVAVISEPPNLDGFIQLGIIRDQLWMMFDKLIDIDQNGVPQPRLAESWEMAPDFTQLTLHLRSGVTFHSGREMTSAD